jgi:hypothetical protein
MTQGASLSGWDLTQYPGTDGAVTTPIALNQQVAALINGGALSNGDLLARISDIEAKFTAVTKGGTPNAVSRRLLVEGSGKVYDTISVTPLNGVILYPGYLSVIRLYESFAHIILVLTCGASGLAGGSIICNTPFNCSRTYALTASNKSIQAEGTSVIHRDSLSPNSSIDCAFTVPYA